MKTIKLGIFLLATLGLTACSNGAQSSRVSTKAAQNDSFDSGNNSGELPTSIDEVSTKEVEDLAADAEQALVEAELALSELLDQNGNIKLNLFGKKASTSEAETQLFISQHIAKALDLVLEKLQVIPDAFDKIRAKIAVPLSKLDPNNPAHQMAIQKLMEVMDKVDQIEARLKTVIGTLGGKINLVTRTIDTFIATTGTNPLLFVVAWELQDIKIVILDFQTKLMNL